MFHHSPVRLAGLAGALTILLAACGSGAPDTATPVPPDATAAPSQDPSPSADETTEPAEADCSAAGVTLPAPDLSALPEPARSTAEFLLDAALRCDEQLLVTAAQESQTRLTFGDVEAGAFFGLPERDDQPVYAIIARLIAGTSFAKADGIDVRVFPAVTTGNGSDEDWETLVTSGLYTSDQVDMLRAAGDGYLGWRLGIDAAGNWTFFVAGD